MLAVRLAQARPVVGHLKQRESPITLNNPPGTDPDRSAINQRIDAILHQAADHHAQLRHVGPNRHRPLRLHIEPATPRIRVFLQ